MTQYDMILKYLDDHGSISPFEAFERLHITKLATRISEMKRKGYRFDTDLIPHVNIYGKKEYFARYRRVS